MGIMLGNLTVNQIETRLQITLSDHDREALSKIRQNDAQNIAPGTWHCFDIPFVLVCGDYNAAVTVRDILTPYSGQMKGQLQIAMESKKDVSL